ncbi:MAG: gamma-glutamyltransferase [Porticoccaceae bacterium]|nr:gamma-glutamyltransferase [Porticoccaceae bacterium]
MTNKIFISATAILIILLQACENPSAERQQTLLSPAIAPMANAAIAMPDSFAAQVSEDILRAGGNAVDAAIAAGFSLAVTFIDAGNIGGGGFMTLKMGDEVAFLDYREKAPLAADKNMFLDSDGDLIEKATLIGGRAVAVPGTVAGFWAAHQRFGKLPWGDLVAPAVKLAEQGFIPADTLVDDIHDMQKWFADKTNFYEYFSAIRKNQVFKQPELAATLKRIAESGADDFYRGHTARLIVEQMHRSEGLISAQDLEKYITVWRQPLQAKWRGYQIVSSPPPSSGGFAVVQLLKMKDSLDSLFDGLEHNSPQYIHLIAEMEKRVFADRAEYLGDPDFYPVNIDALLDDRYIAKRAAEVDAINISQIESLNPGLESPNTTHFSIVDQWGNAVSNTYTINWNYGSGVVVGGAGFLLNNEMDDFSAKPGVPNIFGVVGSEANEVQPEKRPLSSMAPTLLLKDGEVEMVLGTPGGSTIFTTVFQVIVNILDFNMTPDEAVGATRFHHQLIPADLITYSGFSMGKPLSPATIEALAGRGYRTLPHDFEYGDVQIVVRDGESWYAASDPRDRGDSRVLENMRTSPNKSPVFSDASSRTD